MMVNKKHTGCLSRWYLAKCASYERHYGGRVIVDAVPQRPESFHSVLDWNGLYAIRTVANWM